MRNNKQFIIPVAVLVVIIALFASRTTLERWAFNLTGEESTAGQVRGMAQLALNITRPQPQTEPYVPVEHADVNPFGINTFLHNEVEVSKRERQVQLIADAGIYWVREEFPWEDIEVHGRGDFIDRRNDPAGVDAWEKYDNIVDLVEQHDLELIVRLSNPPEWSRAAGNDIGAMAPPDDYTDYANYAAAVVERYAGRVSYYQVWNEPNIYPEWGEQAVNPEDYTELLCQAYDAIKVADPDAIVISGALAPTSELSGRDFNDFIFLQRMYDTGAGDCFDILAMQGYGLWSGPTDHRMRPIVVNYGRNQYIRDIMVKNGDADKAIWISEMNWNAAPEDVYPAYGRVTLEQQARFAPLAYQRAEEEWPWLGVVNFWYFKRADWSWLDEQRPEAYFQMADPDFNLMPVYDSMQAYTAQEPRIHMGAHTLDHWAVDCTETGADEMRCDFAFEGARVYVKSPEACQFSYTLDGGSRQSVDDCSSERIFYGSRSIHSVELVTATPDDILITIYPRRDIRSLVGLVLIGAMILIGRSTRRSAQRGGR